MENLNKKWRKKVPVSIIDASLDKYSQDKRVLAKLQEDKEWLAKVGMPDLYHEEQAKLKAKKPQNLVAQKANEVKSLLYETQNTEALLVAHEPMPEYNAPKQAEA